ncbi:MAG: FAD-dependent oxidoreductase [Rhodovarius sp.]|nr:FAD-dependent oxidoreductase [Rhodovarius sp.]
MSAIHVVGGGVAGLAGALALARAGRPVVLHEAAPMAGGRARALADGTDNGTHALVGANTAALRFLERIGARSGWLEPEPEGLPVLDLADNSARRIALSPFAWWRRSRRPPGCSIGAVLAMARLASPWRDVPVARAMAEHPAFHRSFVDPLVMATLNTPSSEASSARLGQVLRRLGAPGATRLLVAERGLGPDLVEPALDALRAAGVDIRFNSRLRAIEVEEGRLSALIFDSRIHADAALLALPPWEAARLLPGLPVPEAFAPIVNLHFERKGPGPVRFLGCLGGLCQWVLVRPSGVAVTVSAGDAEAELPAEALAPRAWAEVLRLAAVFRLPGEWPLQPPRCRVVKERRATPRHLPGPPPAPPRRPLPNLALAGDWTWPHLPATIEAAVRSGEAAAAALLGVPLGNTPIRLPRRGAWLSLPETRTVGAAANGRAARSP